MAEAAVGIATFMNELNPIEALLKYRMTDFIVEEIDLKGNVVRSGKDLKEELEKVIKKGNAVAEVTPEQLELLRPLLPEEDFEKLSKYVQLSPQEQKAKKEKFKISVNNASKERRSEIHAIVKKAVPGFSSETIEFDNQKYIQIALDAGNRGQEHAVAFVMRKRNWDTLSAINKISRELKKPAGNFCYAGIKDKRGETVQKVIAKKVTCREIAQLGLRPYWRLNEISFSDIRPTNETIDIGDLTGNRFTIALRLLEEASEISLNFACEETAKNGFLNYFGLQRFGSKDEVILSA